MSEIPKKIKVVRRRMAAQIETVEKLCERFDDAKLAEIERVAKIDSTVDGFPAGGSGSGSTEVANPTLMAVINRLDTRQIRDPRQLSAETVASSLEEAWQAMTRAERAMALFASQAELKLGRESSLSECICCNAAVVGIGNDRLRAGYCPACYQAWLRTKTANGPRMDRAKFESHRRHELSKRESENQ